MWVKCEGCRKEIYRSDTWIKSQSNPILCDDCRLKKAELGESFQGELAKIVQRIAEELKEIKIMLREQIARRK